MSRDGVERPPVCSGKALFERLLEAAREDVTKKNRDIREYLKLPQTSKEKQYDVTVHRQQIGFTVWNVDIGNKEFVHVILPDAEGAVLEVLKIHDQPQKLVVRAVLSKDGECVPELDGKQVKCEALTRLALEAMFRGTPGARNQSASAP